MEDLLPPDFSTFDKPDMDYFRKKGGQEHEPEAHAVIVPDAAPAAVVEHDVVDDVIDLETCHSLQVRDDSASDYDTDIDAPSK